MQAIELYFDGYCPESLVKGQQVEMKLNEDDFWESEATGLQVSIFPPYAAILRWRGSRKFRPSSQLASDVLCGLIMTGAQEEDGKEFFPDEQNVLGNKFDLAWYLDEIVKGKAEFDAAKFNFNDPVFEKQKQYLNGLAPAEFDKLCGFYEQLIASVTNAEFMRNENFQNLHKNLYSLRLVFSFDWQAWNSGWKNINNINFDYSRSSLLDISMYITAIFRADRFCDGTIEQNIKNGTIGKLLARLKDLGNAIN